MEELEVKRVVLVDMNDREIGTMEKLEAHRKGLLHRAYSIFIFNRKEELLLQKRADNKYHSGGLWTNTCCSHPGPVEAMESSAKKRLEEEMGFSCELFPTYSFIYKVELDHGLTEHELDHVLIGFYDQDPVLNPQEASDFRWMNFSELEKDLHLHPDNYTSWFTIIINEQLEQLKASLKSTHESLSKRNI